MKLLITGDWHYRANPPRARKDDFQVTLNEKLQEVGEIARKHDADAIVVPGDVFDSPNPAYSTLTMAEAAIRAMRKSVYAVAGNHDEHAHSIESLSRTAYGHLEATGLIRDLMSDPLLRNDITITGTGFSTQTDSDITDYLVPQDAPKALVHIHVAHGMLLERSPGFDLKHTLLEDVAKHPDCPQVCIVGHEHLGFGVKRLPRKAGGEVVFINPGALVRLTAHPGEIERMPQVCLLEVYPGTAPKCYNCGTLMECDKTTQQDGRIYYDTKCPACKTHLLQSDKTWGPPELWNIGHPVIETTLIPLSCAKPGHEVLSREHIEARADRDAKMGEFLNLLAHEGEAKFLDTQAIVEGIANAEGLPRPVVDEALRRIAAAREALGGRTA